MANKQTYNNFRQRSLLDTIVFVHVPKNGGTSISRKIKPFVNYYRHNIMFTHIVKNKIKQLIVIRDPVNRFISAANYHCNRIKDEKIDPILVKEKFFGPENWAQALFNKDHRFHELCWESARSDDHCLINNTRIQYKYHFAPQYLWFYDPDYVVLFEYIKTEIQYFCKKFFNTNIEIEQLNRSYGQKFLSEDSIDRIKKFYANDMSLYSYYKSIPLESRMTGGFKKDLWLKIFYENS